MQQGKYDQAVADFSRALESNPNHSLAEKNMQNARQKMVVIAGAIIPD